MKYTCFIYCQNIEVNISKIFTLLVKGEFKLAFILVQKSVPKFLTLILKNVFKDNFGRKELTQFPLFCGFYIRTFIIGIQN